MISLKHFRVKLNKVSGLISKIEDLVTDANLKFVMDEWSIINNQSIDIWLINIFLDLEIKSKYVIQD